MKYFIESVTLENIANAIREKAGISTDLYPDSMPSYIRSIQTSSGEADLTGIPTDIIAEADRVTSGMIAKMGGNSLTFTAISDTHDLGDSDTSNASVIEQFRRSNKNAGQGAWLISQKFPLDFCAILGDYCYGAKTTNLVTSYYDWINSITAVKQYTSQIRKDVQIVEVPGNHDVLFDIKGEEGTYITNDLISGIIGKYRYIDIENRKVRVIALNTAEYTAGYISEGRMSGEQLQWFANTLDLSGKADASNWGIIILSHHPLDWDGLGNAVGVLKAYVNGTNYSVNHNGIAISYNFAGKNTAKIIAQFHGHTHCFRVNNIGDTSIKRVAIPNACFNRNNEYSSNPDKESFSETTTYEKNDKKEGKNTAFCLVSIDLDKKRIYADCFGAGYDRVIEYDEEEDIVTYLVTTNLQNATSNGSTYAIENEPYTATITADPGYELVNVTCVMGTESVSVTNGIIDIPKVTGDITITATTRAIAVVCNITTNLYKVTNSNKATTVAKGGSYTSTLIPDNGYALDTVEVIMNNEPITVVDGVIDIPEVTGDITITATAKSIYNVNNLVLTSQKVDSEDPYGQDYDGDGKADGYLNGVYCSSDGGDKAAPAGNTLVSTGYIPYEWNTNNIIYIRGAALTNSSYVRIYGYSNKGAAPSSSTSATGSNLSTYFEVEELESGTYYKLTPKGGKITSWIRFTLIGTGENLIITVNEPIG